ncbi:recombinase family protein [Sinorhizobium meliloti]|uniref:recombinase family protein n=1 Tax=Rhizobium meliloti TaxID=382 RepID=UPI00398CC10E
MERPGFERLVAQVCSGNVGAVYCIEASRLARNGRDWHHLIDLCALAGTLVIDPDGAYDPRLVNDRLLLGLKGTMSEYELSLMRQRGIAARDSKADAVSCGLCCRRACAGAKWARSRLIRTNVAETIRLVLPNSGNWEVDDKFFLWLRSADIKMPVVLRAMSTSANLSGRHQPITASCRSSTTRSMRAPMPSEDVRSERGSSMAAPARPQGCKSRDEWSVPLRDNHEAATSVGGV